MLSGKQLRKLRRVQEKQRHRETQKIRMKMLLKNKQACLLWNKLNLKKYNKMPYPKYKFLSQLILKLRQQNHKLHLLKKLLLKVFPVHL
jgi:hypothetical protein